MKRINYILTFYICCLLTAVSFSAEAQTYYSIPDVNLRNKLVSDYPSLMTADSLLDVTAAKAMSADLNLDACGIVNADGIQFFEKTGILRLRNNKVTDVWELSYMKNLRRVYINGNMITSIPDLSALYQLIDLYVGNNKITSLASSNFNQRTTLQFFNCAGNNLSELPDLSALVNLKTIFIGYNPMLLTLPDLSNNLALQQIDISNSNISTIPSLPLLTNLEVFNCRNSKMVDLSGLNLNTKLTTLDASENGLTILPDLSNKPALTSVDVSNNNLTFEDLIPLASLSTFAAFTYAPQKDLSIPAVVNIREQNNYTYQLSIDPSVSSNLYSWKKNTVLLVTGSDSFFSFTPALMSDSGLYSVSVTNPSLPLLELKSNVSKFSVSACLEVDQLMITTLSANCIKGANIDFNGTIVQGALAPVHYSLTNVNTSQQFYNPVGQQFENVIPGSYVVTITDSKNCTIHKSFIFDELQGCDKAFSPNGDGIMDNYFIDDTGTARIYNTSKKLIKTISLPGAWDGTSNEGKLMDAGYYIIIINESTSIGVSIMR
ncbi:MAG: leucine-rich repeat domain-containing protein [Cytophaga sp.]|uniref:leucine-rich repeat domain-containing protein n=1 Tax=Cytophaga sp. TaxID=29535 RepID=UPI003F7E0AFF